MKKSWAIVLAGGDGTRLRPLTRLICGSDLPKQFVPLVGSRSPLQSTLSRIAPQFPAERTLVIVGESHQQVAARQLRPYEGIELVVQPRNHGTAPGILLPLAKIRAREPNASVAIFPSDHYVPRPEPLLGAVEKALVGVEEPHVTVLGVEPDGPETDFGWIVLGRPAPWKAAGCWSVRRFVEKPTRSLAELLLRQGALWNTFITAGPLPAIWGMARKHLPGLTSLFETYVGAVGQTDESITLNHIYSQMTTADFSRAAGATGVLRSAYSGPSV